MSDVTHDGELKVFLEDALGQAQSIQARIAAGEVIDEAEMRVFLSGLATQMEQARMMLEQVVGHVDPEALREHMRKKLGEDEFREWLQGENARAEAAKSAKPNPLEEGN